MLSVRTYLLIVLSACISQVVKATDYVVPSGVTVLTGEQILQQAVGNTFVNELFDEYWEPPSGDQKKGFFRAKHKRGKYSGNWEVKGNLFCYYFDKGLFDLYDGTCYTISLNGSEAIFYNTDGSTWYPEGGRLKLVPGNPKNL
jgi:hypothetical protein